MNIGLVNLSHATLGVPTNTVPLGIASIAHYLKTNVAHTFDIKLFKNPEKCLDVLKRWKPDVLGIAQYSWNSELNLHIARMVQRENINCVIIASVIVKGRI